MQAESGTILYMYVCIDKNSAEFGQSLILGGYESYHMWSVINLINAMMGWK